jgi:hypothetical protein
VDSSSLFVHQLIGDDGVVELSRHFGSSSPKQGRLDTDGQHYGVFYIMGEGVLILGVGFGLQKFFTLCEYHRVVLRVVFINLQAKNPWADSIRQFSGFMDGVVPESSRVLDSALPKSGFVRIISEVRVRATVRRLTTSIKS